VVVVIVALFAVSIVTQSGAGADAPPRSGLVDLLTDRLGASAAVDPAELSGSCRRTGDNIIVQGSCVIDVAQSDKSLRQLKLHNDGPRVRITARVPRRTDTAEKDVQPGAAISVAVDGAATPVGIVCTDLAPCQLRVSL
jgi:hypothetical protein